MEKQRDKAARRAQRKENYHAPGVDGIPIEPFEDYLSDSEETPAAETSETQPE
jgi:hypothetical protein